MTMSSSKRPVPGLPTQSVNVPPRWEVVSIALRVAEVGVWFAHVDGYADASLRGL